MLLDDCHILTCLSPYRIGNNRIELTLSYSNLGVCIDMTLKFHTDISRNVAVLNGMTNNVFNCTLSRDKDILFNIYVSYVHPKLEYASCLWNVGYLGDVRLLERVQRRWTRVVIGFSDGQY